jgi:hypothetical protein
MALDARPNETGGLLLGWREDRVVVVVDAVSISGSLVDASNFIIGQDEANSALESYRAQSNRPGVGYVGSWHSHPSMLGPSTRDFRTYADVSRGTPGALAFIVVAINHGQVILYRHVATGSPHEPQIVSPGPVSIDEEDSNERSETR